MLKTVMIAGLAVLSVSAWTPASAAPLPAQQADQGTPAAQKVDYRRCWYRGGSRVCRYYRTYRSYGYRNYGYGPGFGFYFGPGRYGHRHRHWW